MQPHGVAYDTGAGAYMVRLTVPPTSLEVLTANAAQHARAHTIIIMDVSGSMGRSVPRLIRDILPAALEKAGLGHRETVHLIPFNSTASWITTTPLEMKQNRIVANGGTSLSPAISVLTTLMEQLSAQDRAHFGPHCLSRFNVLALSDGDINDSTETLTAAVSFKESLPERGWRVNAQAVRFFSSFCASPDTRALASVLQWNTEGVAQMVDIDAESNDAHIEDSIAALMNVSNTSIFVTTTDGGDDEGLEAFLTAPWLNASAGHRQFVAACQSDRQLAPLTISLWMSASCWSPAMGPLFLNHRIPVPVEVSALTESTHSAFLASVHEMLVTSAARLRVMNSTESMSELNKMLAFFTTIESCVISDGVADEEDRQTDGEAQRNAVSVHRRVKLLQKKLAKQRVSITATLRHLLNENRLESFNNQQKADFLRSVGSNRNTAKGLVRRAGASEDVDVLARREAVAITLHLAELEAALNDEAIESLSVSFINQGSVLDGFRAIAEFTRAQTDAFQSNSSRGATEADQMEEALAEVTALDLLELLNLVGIPATARSVGDFPDPFTYTLDHLYHGVFLSLSDCVSFDALAAQMNGRQQQDTSPESHYWGGVTIPGVAAGRVSDIIPVVEHPQVGAFLRRYAPQMWNMTAGIGMRRVLAVVPLTAAAHVTAGMLCAVQSFHSGEGGSAALKSLRLLLNAVLASRPAATMISEMKVVECQPEPPQDCLCAVERQPSDTRWLAPVATAFQSVRTQRAGRHGTFTDPASWWPNTLRDGNLFPPSLQKFLRSWLAFTVFRHVQRLLRRGGDAQEEATLIETHLCDMLGLTEEVAQLSVTQWPEPELFTFRPEEAEAFSAAQGTTPDSAIPVVSGAWDVLRLLGAHHTAQGVDHQPSPLHTLHSKVVRVIENCLQQVVYMWWAVDLAEENADMADTAAKAVRESCLEDSDAFYAGVLSSFFGIDATSAAPMQDAPPGLSRPRAFRLEVHLALVGLALLYPTMEKRLTAVSDATPAAEQDSVVPEYKNLASVRALFVTKRASALAKMRTRVAGNKAKARREWLSKALVKRLCALPIADAVPFWEKGLFYMPDKTFASCPPSPSSEQKWTDEGKRPFYHIQLLNHADFGVGLLATALLCGSFADDEMGQRVAVSDVPAKIATLLTGRLLPPTTAMNTGSTPLTAEALPIVWNNGANWMGLRLDAYRDAVVLRSPSGAAEWEVIRAVYGSQNTHNYPRGNEPNRHTHSDEKPSYFAMGFATLEDFAASVSAPVWAEYCKEHCNCCGLEGFTVKENVVRQEEIIRESEMVHEQSRAHKRASRDARNARKKRRREEEEAAAHGNKRTRRQ